MFGCSSEAASRASALKRATAVCVLRVLGRDDLQRDRAVEVGVGRLVDDAHPAAIEQALDPVAGEHGAGLEVWKGRPCLIPLVRHDAHLPADVLKRGTGRTAFIRRDARPRA